MPDDPQHSLPTLPMHLLLSMGCYLSSPFASQCANAGLLPWNRQSPNQQLSARQQLAINAEAKNRATSLLEGVLRYQKTPYKRDVIEPPAIWQSGSARLLDYGSLIDDKSQRPIVLFIPSLINRYYILDLEEERSMLRYLTEQGSYPLVLDWGEPGAREAQFGVDDYVRDILVTVIGFISRVSGQKITLAGYCMGGVLALAALKLARRHVSSLALFAAPWDFHCKEFAPFILDKPYLASLDSMITSQKTLPADFVQALFYVTDPFVFEQKFRRYAELHEGSRAARDFVALEHWVNDGVPMTAKVARDCLIGWSQKNMLSKEQWKIDGHTITPRGLKLPVFMAIPQNDHVVPHDCAMPLAKALPHAQLIHPSAGHVGMIVGSRARRELWQPFSEWLASL